MPSTDVPRSRIALPRDLSTSLQYLEDAELQRLRDAVVTEINRRTQGTPTNKTGASAARPSPEARNKDRVVEEIPEGRANLIRASFSAGLKPAAIARMFGVSPSLVNRLIRATEKAKR